MGADKSYNILLLGVQVPFTRGGAEALIGRLGSELAKRGHTVDTVQLPFSAIPKSDLVGHMLAWRGLKLEEFAGRPVDLVIPTKFPSYLVRHRCKVPWLVHQHRQLYELYGGRFSDFDTSAEDETLRRMVFEADTIGLSECASIFTIAPNVSARLERFLETSSTALPPPPPLGDAYRPGERGDYILSVGRLCSIKRVDLIIRSMPEIDRRLRLKIVGAPDEPGIEEYLRSELDKHHLTHRVEFLGRVSDEDLIGLYAGAFAVYYAPHDEDYGFVTIEARASAKPVVTAHDSGSVLDFIRHEENGLIAEPTEKGISAAVNRLLADEELYSRLAYREEPAKLTASWDSIVANLLAPIEAQEEVAATA